MYTMENVKQGDFIFIDSSVYSENESTDPLKFRVTEVFEDGVEGYIDDADSKYDQNILNIFYDDIVNLVSTHPENLTASQDEFVRLSVNLAPDVAAILQNIAERKNDSLTETVRRAITVLHLLEEESAKGNDILVNDGKHLVKITLI